MRGVLVSTHDYFNAHLGHGDSVIFEALEKEHQRQSEGLELIASENIVSQAVLDAVGSVFSNKYAEGYSGRRYYGGCVQMDVVETLAIERACQLFGASYANVQSHSGSQANQAAFAALMKPGDTFMGLSLSSGGHLTHGSKVNQSGKWFQVVGYDVRRQDARIDMDQVRDLARAHKPQVIIAGATAYARQFDFAAFREICDEVGARLMVDMAHFAGLVAAGEHPNPLPHADIVTTTTHKTLRSARGGMILTNDAEMAKKINTSVFPGLQGGPLMHMIAGKAVGFGEALQPAFKGYIKAVIENARTLAACLQEGGLDIVTGGTDNHLVLVDLRPWGLTGVDSDAALERAGITCNKNSVPFDETSPMVTSGIRLGSPAATTRGLGAEEFRTVGSLILEVLDGLRRHGAENNQQVESAVHERVRALCAGFPLYERPHR